jgi:hypothetical protein
MVGGEGVSNSDSQVSAQQVYVLNGMHKCLVVSKPAGS